MSYARWGQDGSDVYVYLATSGDFLCCGCPRLGDDARCVTAREMADHLEIDRAAGFKVPQRALDGLRAHGDGYVARVRARRTKP